MLHFVRYIELGGTLDEVTFSRIEFKIEKLLDDATNLRIRHAVNTERSLEMLIYELILIEQEKEKTVNISSESNDGVSLSYRYDDNTTILKKQNSLIHQYLSDVICEDGQSVLFRGIIKKKENR